MMNGTRYNCLQRSKKIGARKTKEGSYQFSSSATKPVNGRYAIVEGHPEHQVSSPTLSQACILLFFSS